LAQPALRRHIAWLTDDVISKKRGATMPGPLHGYRIIDLTSMISGP